MPGVPRRVVSRKGAADGNWRPLTAAMVGSRVISTTVTAIQVFIAEDCLRYFPNPVSGLFRAESRAVRRCQLCRAGI